VNFEMPFIIPNFASGSELRKIREAHHVSVPDLARVMATARSYVLKIEAKSFCRRCTCQRYLLAVHAFVTVRTAAAAQKSKNSSNAEKTDANTTHSS
jgi:hypothetical protein